MSPIPSLHHKYRLDSQSTHRVAMTTFWRTFNPDGKIRLVKLGASTPFPFHSIYTIHKRSCGVRSS